MSSFNDDDETESEVYEECQWTPTVITTAFRMYGCDDLLQSIGYEVVRPLRALRYGLVHGESDLMKKKVPPKLILFNGPDGCGKKSLTSVLVNELRRGSSNKRSDVFYDNRKVEFLDLWMYSGVVVDILKKLLAANRIPSNGADFTVIQIRDAHEIFRKDFPEGETVVDENRHRWGPRTNHQTKMVTTLVEELNNTPPGKWLIVCMTNRMEFMAQEVLAKVDHTFQVPLPDKYMKETILKNFFREYNAEYGSNWNKLINAIHCSYNPCQITQLKFSFTKAVQNAKFRVTYVERNRGNNNAPPPRWVAPITLLWEDFKDHLRESDDEREDNESQEESASQQNSRSPVPVPAPQNLPIPPPHQPPAIRSRMIALLDDVDDDDDDDDDYMINADENEEENENGNDSESEENVTESDDDDGDSEGEDDVEMENMEH